MTVSPPPVFPPRKRRPSAGAFIAPNFSDHKLIQSLLILSQEISSLKPLQYILKSTSLSIIRKIKLLSILFEELVRNPNPFFSPTLLCFEEMYIVLQRIKTLIEDCSNGSSKIWLLFQFESVAASFHELTLELSTLLDIFPVNEMNLSDDVQELVFLIRKQLAEAKVILDPRDVQLREQVVTMLDRIKKEIVPSQLMLSEIFNRLALCNSSSCRDELEILEDEIQNQIDEKSKCQIVSLIGLVRYGKCVLYGASTPVTDNRRRKVVAEVNIPTDFRCPISLDLMRDPVVVATGQTYDRESINLWIESGHNTCPKTGQTLAHANLIPNRALKNLIAMWCREQKIPFESAADGGQQLTQNGGVIRNKAALEATKMTVSFLVNKLSNSQSLEAANGVVYELRALAKTDSDSRTCMGEASTIPLLVRYLGSDVGSSLPNLQVNAVTTVLNLSILEENKTRIMETDGALNGVIEVLRSGATLEAKGNAAATIFSLCGVHSYRKKLGKKTRVLKGLIDLAKNGNSCSKRDALMAILNLAGDRETASRLVEGGVIDMVNDIVNVLPEEAVTVLEVVVKRGGIFAVAAAYNSIRKISNLLRQGTDSAREIVAAILVNLCRKGGSEMVAELASINGIERMIWELMGSGTIRARRKAASLMRILRRWAAGMDGSDHSIVSATISSSSRATLAS
ncbi:U-box domain-containing protein 16 [Mercurialis annua]|uniref:U-box domain-containing protein 16 n=1 Tax=Mercurialis annua TaxID=3986 RepID=UPI002160A230|nr:U-box domain-containing protein 16 [Mercurialis annua]